MKEKEERTMRLKCQRILCAMLAVLLIISGLYVEQDSSLTKAGTDYGTSDDSCLTGHIPDSDEEICTVEMLETQSSMILKQIKSGRYEKENGKYTPFDFLNTPIFSLKLFTSISCLAVGNSIYSFLNNSLIIFIHDSDGKK